MDSMGNKKLALLYVLKILQRNSDCDHPIWKNHLESFAILSFQDSLNLLLHIKKTSSKYYLIMIFQRLVLRFANRNCSLRVICLKDQVRLVRRTQ